MYLIISILTILGSSTINAEFSFKKMYHYVIPEKQHEEIIYEEYNPKKALVCTIKNKRGNVLVKTHSNNLILVKATKRLAQTQDLSLLTFTHSITDQEFLLAANYDDTLIDGSIDFEIVVPQKIAVNVHTFNGSIFAKDVYNPFKAITDTGSIDIVNAHNTVDAHIHAKGTILIKNPGASIQAHTQSGNISIYDAHASVFANTHNGTISLFAKDVPSTSTINLATVSGSILLHLPPDVNADIQAYTKNGTIVSDHFITLKPQTTQLNSKAWRRLQKQVEGTIGSGEAQIKLTSVRSDIKLLEMKLS